MYINGKMRFSFFLVLNFLCDLKSGLETMSDLIALKEIVMLWSTTRHLTEYLNIIFILLISTFF